MNIEEALLAIAKANGFRRLDIGVYTDEETPRYLVTVWGDGFNIHGCTSGSGDTAVDAIASVTKAVAEMRAARHSTIEMEIAA